MAGSRNSAMLLTTCSLLLLAGAMGAAGVQSFLREPFDQIATVGEHVTLPCRVVNKVGVLQWTREDFGLGSGRELDGFRRYVMTGSDEEGDFTLDINPVDLADDGRFQCQVGAAEGVAPIRSRYATLTVLVPPEPPKIYPEGHAFKTVEGKEVELRCESRGGKPAAEITWFDHDNNVLETGVQTVQELMSDGKRFTTVSLLRFRAEVKHHGRNFTCQAQNSANRQPHSTSIRLEVHYTPQVSVTSSREKLLEGDSVRFTCHADGNPGHQLTYAWRVGQRVMDEADVSSSQLVLDSVDRNLDGQEVRCQVTNSIGRGEAAVTLNVSYAPVFLHRPENVAGLPGERLNLRCRVDSNPSPSYAWYYQRSPSSSTPAKLVSSSANLSLEASASTEGQYECHASVPGYGDVSAKAFMYLKGPPKILAADRAQHTELGTTGQVVCQAFSVPSAELVEWSFKGLQLDLPGNSGKYSVVENKSPEGIRSTLVIQDVRQEDLGNYVCTVANVMGTSSALLHLRKKSPMPLLVVIAGVIGGVILTMAIILMLILCRRNIITAKKLSSDLIAIKTTTQKKSQEQAEKDGAANDPEKTKTAPPSTTTMTTTASDGLSNDSSELKVEIRTPSSLSEQHQEDWDGSDDSYKPYQNGKQQHTDYVDGSGFENYGEYYTNNLLQASTNYFASRGYATSPGHLQSGPGHAPYGSQRRVPHPHSPMASNGYGHKSSDNLLSTDSAGTTTESTSSSGAGHGPHHQRRYSVHVRNSPTSPNGGAAVSLKDYGHNNSTFDYVPASALLGPANAQSEQYRPTRYSGQVSSPNGALDNYAVYVNGPQIPPANGCSPPASGVSSTSTASTLPYHVQHEIVVPVHEGSSGGSSAGGGGGSNGGGSLATHV